MSKLQVKIDGEWKDFCEAVDKPLVYLEQDEISKIKILTDIRDYLVKCKEVLGEQPDFVNFLLSVEVQAFIEKALADLTEYAEKLGVEL